MGTEETDSLIQALTWFGGAVVAILACWLFYSHLGLLPLAFGILGLVYASENWNEYREQNRIRKDNERFSKDK